MSFIVFLYASGWAFYVGGGLVLVALLLPKSRQRLAKTLVAIGVVAFVLPSSCPLPWLAYAFLALITLVWWRRPEGIPHVREAAFCFWMVALIHESGYHLTKVKPIRNPSRVSIAVVGDSLTSGLLETKAVNWPKLLSKNPRVAEVHDFAVEGATSRKAMTQAEKIPGSIDVVVIAIGGNDVLGQSTLAEFERDYDALLARIAHPSRKLVGLELPLPPFHNGWASAQREIARRHNVWLIPKWRLMRILSDLKNTVDSIHPSQEGQNAIADMVGRIVLGDK